MVTVASWMKQALNNCNMDKLSVYSMREDFNNYFNKNTSEESFKRNVRIYYNEMIGKDSDIDEETLIKLAASRQGFMDKNNHERKVNRESFRVFNTLEAIFTEYNELLKKTNLSSYKMQKESTENAKYGVIQITDTHFNEFIAKNESSGNDYQRFPWHDIHILWNWISNCPGDQKASCGQIIAIAAESGAVPLWTKYKWKTQKVNKLIREF